MAWIFLLNKIVRSIPLKFAVSLSESLVSFYVTIKVVNGGIPCVEHYSILPHLHSILIIT